jgi:hypothetical protein
VKNKRSDEKFQAIESIGNSVLFHIVKYYSEKIADAGHLWD